MRIADGIGRREVRQGALIARAGIADDLLTDEVYECGLEAAEGTRIAMTLSGTGVRDQCRDVATGGRLTTAAVPGVVAP